MTETPSQEKGKPGPKPTDPWLYVDEIEEWIASGKTLRDYARQPGKPSRRLIDTWRATIPEIGTRIAHARDIGYDVIAEDCLAIADDGVNDTSTDDDGNEVVNHDVIQRSKLRVDTRLKLLAKWDPRRYGDKPTTDDGGAEEVTRLLREAARQIREQEGT